MTTTLPTQSDILAALSRADLKGIELRAYDNARTPEIAAAYLVHLADLRAREDADAKAWGGFRSPFGYISPVDEHARDYRAGAL